MGCVNCGDTGNTGSIPLNSVLGAISCRLPCVREFSTSIDRFRNQIIREVLTALSQRCQAAIPVTVPIILAEMVTNIAFTVTVSFSIEATAVNTVSIAFQNISFQIVGFASAIVAIAADIVTNVSFQGIDGLTHTVAQTAPLAAEVTVPGTFPATAVAAGTLSITNLVIVDDVDPSTLLITGVTVELFLAVDIRILSIAV